MSIPAFSSWNVLEFKFHQIPEKSDLAQNISQKLEIAYILLCIAELDWPSIENFYHSIITSRHLLLKIQ